MKRKSLLAFCCLMAFPVFADVVNVYEETECGGVMVRVADRMLETGRNYKTGAAPAKSGWIFTHWTISTEQDFENRDVWGRAFDETPFKLYEETTLTAHYLPKTQDVNGDGILDLVVEVAGGEAVVYLGCGSEGNPEFKKVAWQPAWAPALAAAKPRPLEGLAFDVKPPADAQSWSFADVDGDGVEDLLMSDSEGRIWYYKESQSFNPSTSQPLNFILLHKVWGGSYAGFAQGLRLAAVDWDDDSDLDCLCGTAEGKLMLLRDPKVGRPTNLRALMGVDNVKLDWDPNQQSRIRGYKVYRKAAEDAAARWGQRALPTLPTYRDYPEEIADYDYKVPVVCDDEHLEPGTMNLIRGNTELLFKGKTDAASLAMKAKFESAKKIEVVGAGAAKGNLAIIADMGIAPAFGEVDETGTLKLTYAMPTLKITSFDAQTGAVRFKVTPGEGNRIVSEIATGYIHVYGTNKLGDPMKYISQVGFDLTPYLKNDTQGEGVLNITLGTHTFLKVKIEAGTKTEGQVE